MAGGYVALRRNIARLWRDPPLEPEIREQLAERALRWVLWPSLVVVVLAAAARITTHEVPAAARILPTAVFAIGWFAAYRLTRAKRWSASAALLCVAATLQVVTTTLLRSSAVSYEMGVVVLALTATVFGLRWAALAALAFIYAGAVALTADAWGMNANAGSFDAFLSYALHAGAIVFALALIGGSRQLLTTALRETTRARARAERARAAEVEAKQALRAVFDQGSVGLALLTADGWIIRLNARAESFFDQTEVALIGSLFAKNPRWTDAQRELLQHAVEQAARGHASQHELTRTREGARAAEVFQIVLSPFHGPGGRVEHVLVEMVDVSDLVETRNMLGQARRLEALGKLSGGVAHDLNNMLGAIMGGCELVRIARGDAQKIDSHVKLIQTSVQRAAALTKQLLAFGRKDCWNSEQLDVNKLLHEVARLLERTLQKKVDLVVLPSDEPCFVRADPAAIEHALLNLALNAQDAMTTGTLTLACRPAVLNEATCQRLNGDIKPGPCVILSVSDTGIGMSAEVQERMFEPFFTTKPPGQGTGLGLAAVHGTMRAHLGAVAVHSQLGIGTRVELIFPAIEPTPVGCVIEEAEVPVPTRLEARVLLADDESLARDAIAGMLESAGCQVHAVADGGALIDALAEGEGPDIIVSDFAMPVVGGINLVQTLELLRPNCPLLLITGYTGDDVASICPPRHGRRLLRKPFMRAELLGNIAELLGQKRLTPMAPRPG